VSKGGSRNKWGRAGAKRAVRVDVYPCMSKMLTRWATQAHRIAHSVPCVDCVPAYRDKCTENGTCKFPQSIFTPDQEGDGGTRMTTIKDRGWWSLLDKGIGYDVLERPDEEIELWLIEEFRSGTIRKQNQDQAERFLRWRWQVELERRVHEANAE
jgi:hypothetical protein